MGKVVEIDRVVNEIARFKGYLDDDMIYRLQLATKRLPTVDAIPVEWLENFTNNYCDLAAAIDTQFFINEFILKRWKVESEGKDTQIKNNAEKNYQYIKKLLREGKTLEAAKFVEGIDTQPTVDAIPVKWLEDYQIREFIKADPNDVSFQRACGVGCAVEAWRKENA